MTDIFLSYATVDLGRARQLAGALEARGWSVWWDRKIPPGRKFDQVIEERLDAARCVITLWSKASIASDWVRAEADEGRCRNVLVPALLDANLKIPLAFRQIQAAGLIDWRGEEGHAGFELLVEAVEHLIGPGPAAATPPGSAGVGAGDGGPLRKSGLGRGAILAGLAVTVVGAVVGWQYLKSGPGPPPDLGPSDVTLTATSMVDARPAGATISMDGARWTEPLTGMEFVRVPGGCFEMGCGSWAGKCENDEKPLHEVCLDDYWMGRNEVTQGQWEEVMGKNPSSKKGAGHPVENVSWDDAQGFIKKLNARGGGLRLPTEAEWEYACRSGGREELYAGGGDLGRVGWYDENSGFETHPVAKKVANGLGLFDMSGNVWEWTQDWYDKEFYAKSGKRNPLNDNRANSRVLRGGAFNNGARWSRCAGRIWYSPAGRNGLNGLRLARSPQD